MLDPYPGPPGSVTLARVDDDGQGSIRPCRKSGSDSETRYGSGLKVILSLSSDTWYANKIFLLTLKNADILESFGSIVCPRSLDHFYAVSHYIKMDKKYWTYSMHDVRGLCVGLTYSCGRYATAVWSVLVSLQISPTTKYLTSQLSTRNRQM